jgi:hypothetical protein
MELSPSTERPRRYWVYAILCALIPFLVVPEMQILAMESRSLSRFWVVFLDQSCGIVFAVSAALAVGFVLAQIVSGLPNGKGGFLRVGRGGLTAIMAAVVLPVGITSHPAMREWRGFLISASCVTAVAAAWIVLPLAIYSRRNRHPN